MISQGYPVDIYWILPPGLGRLGGSEGLCRNDEWHAQTDRQQTGERDARQWKADR